MPELIANIISNILANIIFWLTSGLVVGFILSFRRRKLYRFFGISKNKPVTVYLSSYAVQQNTVKDFRDKIREYEGLGIPNGEFLEIPNITGLFLSNALERIPDTLSGFVDNIWLTKKPIIEFLASPLNENKIRVTNHICIGGPAFNSVTEYYLRTGNPYLTMIEDAGSWTLKICRGRRTGEVIGSIAEHSEWDYGIILKIRDQDKRTSVLILAGLNMNSTRAVSRCLIASWESLYRQYGSEDFGLCVRCPPLDKDSEGYKRFEIITRLPR